MFILYSNFPVVLAASNQTGEEGKGTFFFLLFLLCFFLTLYSNFPIAFNFPIALVASNQTREGGWQGRNRWLCGVRWRGRALCRIGEYGHVAEAAADEVLASTAGSSQGRVCGDRHAFSSWWVVANCAVASLILAPSGKAPPLGSAFTGIIVRTSALQPRIR